MWVCTASVPGKPGPAGEPEHIVSLYWYLALPKLRLFMLPWAAASAPSAPNRQFVTACDVSTLPATTAAGYSGDSIDFFGMTMLIGRRQPPFIGISSSTITRNT